MINANRDEFIEQGFVILRQVIPPDRLEELRRSHEILVERQRAVWARERNPDDLPGGQWETSSQPRLQVSKMGTQHDQQTASTIELWLHENLQSVSSHLLAEDDVPATEMMMMCNPTTDRGPAAWHRDFYPPLNAPLMAYANDIIEGGPRYVQWNIPLYDDDVLWVIPGSHLRPNTALENESIGRDPRVAVAGGVQTHLNAGDGVAYILPIMHWGSNYSTKMRRTIHGGFARLTHYDDTTWMEHLSPTAQETFSRWFRRSEGYMKDAEDALRAVLAKNADAYHAALDALHPGRGPKGVLHSTICLSKTAKHIYNQQCRELGSLSQFEEQGVHMVHPMTLQWGEPLGARFTPEEALLLYERFRPVDEILQSAQEHTLPGFQGKQTRYLFEEVPAELTMESWSASWESGKLGG
jgi:ectoine hydroxylase-related dioxygenase (phytanoyl-CoA dioxygenase family)